MTPPRALLSGQLLLGEAPALMRCARLASCSVSPSTASGGQSRQFWHHYLMNNRLQRNQLPALLAVAPIHTAMVPEVEEAEEEAGAGATGNDQRVLEGNSQKIMERKGEEIELGQGKKEDAKVEEASAVDDSLKIENLNLSKETVRALEKRGITALFPIQKHVFDPASQGRDLIVRAKTGSGKTLAFALPVIENLLKESRDKRPVRGRAPRCLVMAPTRELANQVAREFGSVCPSLSLGCFYGGVPLGGQRRQCSDGIDVAVGTPGRLMDLIEQRVLDLSQIRFAILDESDQMLDMGFEEDMESILSNAPDKRQTMLFSATLPGWVKKVSRKYLQDHVLVDLVGDEATGRIAESIRSLGIMLDRRAKRTILVDLLVVHGAGERSIVFTQTKREADYVASSITTAIPCEALHGDIPQQQRELTLERFRLGKFSVLVATDVAARGLDIPNVDLVVHYDIPQDCEHFLHRSGRTGRAGKSGTTIVMFTKPEGRDVQRIMKETHTKIEIIGPPAPREVMQASTKSVLSRMNSVQPEVVKFFSPAAEKLISAGNGEQVLAAALASMSGFDRVPKPRSLLTQQEGFVSLRVLGRQGKIQTKSHVLRIVSDLVGNHALDKVGQIEMFFDAESHKEGALLDLPVDHAITFLQTAAQNPDGKASKGLVIDRPKQLPMSLCLSNSGYRQEGRGGGRFNDRMNGRFSNRGDGGGGRRGGRDWGRDDMFRRRNSDRGRGSGDWGDRRWDRERDRGRERDRDRDRGFGSGRDRNGSRRRTESGMWG